MQVYAGIDEAGYGPMFGPFVVSRSIFILDEGEPSAEPPILWRTLSRGVCRAASDRRKRIAVNDSKKLYTPATGLAHLERGVLAFLATLDHEPRSVEDLLAAIGLENECRTPDLIWYTQAAAGPAVPTACTRGQIAIASSMLRRCCDSAQVRLVDLCAAVVYENRFNRIVEATRSKARCAWQFVAAHLDAVWQRYGEHHPWVAVDRQGGRRVYHELLALLFEGAEIRLADESADVSRYHVHRGDRSMTISFEVDSEDRHLPVALASMTAKYTRELLMHRLNHYFAAHAPELRPTAGYHTDGLRFLGDIEPLIARLGIERGLLVRMR